MQGNRQRLTPLDISDNFLAHLVQLSEMVKTGSADLMTIQRTLHILERGGPTMFHEIARGLRVLDRMAINSQDYGS